MTEPVLTLKQAAEGLGVSYDSARRIFSAEKGVLRIGQESRQIGRKYRRRYFLLRIPQSVFSRVQDRLTVK